MRFSEARDKYGLTYKEWLLGESVASSEFRQRYQPASMGHKYRQSADTSVQAGNDVACSSLLAGSGEVACSELLESEAWRKLGQEMLGD